MPSGVPRQLTSRQRISTSITRKSSVSPSSTTPEEFEAGTAVALAFEDGHTSNAAWPTSPWPPLDRLKLLVRNRRKRLQYRPDILDGFMAGTGLTLDAPTSP